MSHENRRTSIYVVTQHQHCSPVSNLIASVKNDRPVTNEAASDDTLTLATGEPLVKRSATATPTSVKRRTKRQDLCLVVTVEHKHPNSL